MVDKSSELQTWEEANPDDDHVGLYSGWMMAFRINNEYLANWPEPDLDATAFEYVTKWSGGCFQDMTADQGGFCVLEDNDTDFSPDETRPAYYIYFEYACDETGTSPTECEQQAIDSAGTEIPTATAYVQGNTNRHFNFYRLSKDDFDTFDNAWTDNTTSDADTGMDDGRCYQKSIEGLEVDMTDSALLEYLDYPACFQVDFTSDEEDVDGNVWECHMYLPSLAGQSESNPAIIDPSVLAGYYVSSFIPIRLFSYARTI